MSLPELEQMVNVRMLHWHTDPRTIISVIPGKDWEAEIADTVQSIRELDPRAAAYHDKHADLLAELADLQQREVVPETIEKIPSGKTIGQHYISLSHDEQRDYLAANHDIRAEKVSDSRAIGLVIDGRESFKTTLLGMDHDDDGRPAQL